MNVIREFFDVFIAWTLIVGVIVLMIFRTDLDITSILIMCGAWAFGRGFTTAKNSISKS